MPGDDVAKRLVVAVNDLDGEDESASFEELMKIVVKSGQAKTSDVMEMGKKKKSKNNLNGPSTLKLKIENVVDCVTILVVIIVKFIFMT